MNGELNACFLSKIWCCRHFNGEKFLVLFPPRLDWSARLRERSESPDFSKVATTPNQFCGTQRAAAPKLLNLGTTAGHVWGRTNRLIGAGHKTARIDLFPFCRWLLLSKTRDGAPQGHISSLDLDFGIFLVCGHFYCLGNIWWWFDLDLLHLLKVICSWKSISFWPPMKTSSNNCWWWVIRKNQWLWHTEYTKLCQFKKVFILKQSILSHISFLDFSCRSF